MSSRLFRAVLVLWLFVLAGASGGAEASSIRINEFMANNLNALTDSDGDSPDWIEIHNTSETLQNLEGWFLTDSSKRSDWFRLPQLRIPGGGFVTVFASGKNRALSSQAVHTSFTLSDKGGSLSLINPDGQVVHSYLAYPKQGPDISYGIGANGSVAFFQPSTPGAANEAGSVALVEPVQFSLASGFYDTNATLYLSSATAGAVIRYTTNGAHPSSAAGLVYTSPLLITNTLPLRAQATREGLISLPAESRSYLFTKGIIRQTGLGYPATWRIGPADYAMDPLVVDSPTVPVWRSVIESGLLDLPTVSIVMDPEDLFGLNGVYSNPGAEGIAAERPATIEWLEPGGRPGVRVNAGLRIQGAASRGETSTPKHGFRFFFRSAYGDPKLNYPLFPETPFQTFDTLSLRIFMIDGWAVSHQWAGERDRAVYLRDEIVRRSHHAMGQVTGHGRMAHLYLNGLYWGLYNPQEKPGASFASTYHGGKKEEWDTILTGEAVDGTLEQWNEVIRRVKTDMTVRENYEKAVELIDVDNFIDYMIIQIWACNVDWPHNNWNASRRRAPGEKFKFFTYDTEYSLNLLEQDNSNTEGAGLPIQNPDNPGRVYFNLKTNVEFRVRFGDRLQKHLTNNGALMPRNVTNRFKELVQSLDRAIVPESARWGDAWRPGLAYNREADYYRESGRLLTNFFPQRTQVVWSQFKARGLYPNFDAPGFSQLGGTIPKGFLLNFAKPAGSEVYFTTNGMDPRVMWTNAQDPTATRFSFPVRINDSVVVKARAKKGNDWSALNQGTFLVEELTPSIAFTEIMYHPLGGDVYEFLELQNFGTVPIDLGRAYLTGVDYLFPPDTRLAPGAVVAIASKEFPPSLTNRYPNVKFFGNFLGDLANSGETLSLHRQDGSLLASVTYGDSGGWPEAADGAGPSLEIVNASGDPNDPFNWRASLSVSGSPGSVPSKGALSSVVINEVLSENAGAVTHQGLTPDYVELFNGGGSPISLSGWSLSDDAANPRKFVFPPGSILGSGGYLVIWCEPGPLESTVTGLFSGFGLKKSGERVMLFNTATNRMDGLQLGNQLADLSAGKVGGQWRLCQPTPGAANTPVATGVQGALVINEFLANGGDWVELYNTDMRPVALQGIYVSTLKDSFQVPWLSFVGPKGFVVLEADQGSEVGHLPFTLPASGGRLSLHDSAATLVNRMDYEAQEEGVSRGRLPDGASTLSHFPQTASPGRSNYQLAAGGPQINEILARNRRLVVHGEVSDWVELYGAGSSGLDLSGYELEATGAGAGARVRLSDGTRLEPGAYQVVLLNLPGSGGKVRLLNPLGQVVQEQVYGEQVPGLSIGKSGSGWGLLEQPSPGAANGTTAVLGSGNQLKLNEWKAGGNWVEVYNPEGQPVSLTGIKLMDRGTVPTGEEQGFGPLSYVGRGGYVVLEERQVQDQGGALRLYNGGGVLLDAIDYGVQERVGSQGRLPDGVGLIVNFTGSESPDESNFQLLSGVLIHEGLREEGNPNQEGAVELLNTTASEVDVSGWYVSNDPTQLKLGRLGSSKKIPAKGFLVIYEGEWGSGLKLQSRLSERFYLSQNDGGEGLSGLRAQVEWEAVEPGVSMGDYVTSEGNIERVALSTTTFGKDTASTLAEFRTGKGQPNAYPRVGPIVLSEVMYRPKSGGEEYLELENTSGNEVPLEGYRISGGVTYRFGSAARLSGEGKVVVVGFDPIVESGRKSQMMATYQMSSGAVIVGPWEGELSNSGERIELRRWGAREADGLRRDIMVEALRYRDSGLWPIEADGKGKALVRRKGTDYANDPANWMAGTPSPGPVGELDSDGDGMSDDYERANGLLVHTKDGDADSDGDGVSNYHEFLSGTAAGDKGSVLKLRVQQAVGGVRLRFTAAAGKGYEVERRTDLKSNAPWQLWQNVAPGEARELEISDNVGGYYRLKVK